MILEICHPHFHYCLIGDVSVEDKGGMAEGIDKGPKIASSEEEVVDGHVTSTVRHMTLTVQDNQDRLKAKKV